MEFTLTGLTPLQVSIAPVSAIAVHDHSVLVRSSTTNDQLGDHVMFYGTINNTLLHGNTSLEDDDITEQALDTLLSDILGIWITGIICLTGLAGNILSFLVLSRAHGHSPMFCVLRAVAVSDGVFLLTVFISTTLVNMYPQTHLLSYCFLYRGYIQYVVWPMLMVTQMSTVWLTVLVSLERYVAICHPLKAASICTMSKVRKSVISIYAVSIIYNIPRYLEYEVVDNTYMDKTYIGNHKVYRYLYNCVLYSLVLFFVPLISLILLNAKLVLALQRGKKQWQNLQFRQKKEQNLTVIPLTIVLFFFLCGTPSLVVNVIDSMNPSRTAEKSFVVFMVVSNLLVVINSACNFIIYCFLGKKFRSKLMEMCRCNRCSRHYQHVHSSMNSQASDI